MPSSLGPSSGGAYSTPSRVSGRGRGEEDDRSRGSVSWQSRMDDSARNSTDGSHKSSHGGRSSRRGDAESVSKADSRHTRRHHGRSSRGDAPPTVTVSKNFIVFVAAGLAFFGLSAVGAGNSNRAFERHFQEIAKVRADRRKLKEENEALRRENARLRARIGGGTYYETTVPLQEVAAVSDARGVVVHGFQG